MDSPSPHKKAKLETGTCNVCAAPCSSCVHFSQMETGTESKVEEECSTVCGGEPTNRLKRKKSSGHQLILNETSNLLSLSSYSENAESKLLVRGRDEVDDVEAVGAAVKEGIIVGKGSSDKAQNDVHSKSNFSCLDVEKHLDGEDLEANCLGSGSYEQGKGSSMLRAAEKSSAHLQPTSDSEQSESDIIEQDVKVCDICGDAGREDLLAICGRCSDGAEHTYCMQVMLDKVPEGEWFCEGCKLEVSAKKEKTEKGAGLTSTSKGPQSEEKVKVSAHDSNVTLFPKSVTKATTEWKASDNKVVLSPQSSLKCQIENIEISSMPRQEVHNIASKDSGKKPSLSRGYSLQNMDFAKEKYAGHRTTNDTDEFSSPGTMSVTTSSRLHQHNRHKGLLSRSTTFSNLSVKTKVTLLQDDMCHRQILDRESGSNDVKKNVLSHTLHKSMSFRTASSVCSNASDSKLKELTPFNDFKGLKFAKEKYPLERRSSFKLDNHSASSTPSAVSAPMAKTFQAASVTCKGVDVSSSDSAGELNKLSFSNGTCITGDQRQQSITGDQRQQTSCSNSEKKLKGTNLTPRAWQPVVARPQSGRCSKCNNNGHTTELCPVSDLRCAYMRGYAAKNFKEGSNKNSKWRVVKDAALSKTIPPSSTSHNGLCNNYSNSVSVNRNSNKMSDKQGEASIISNAVLSNHSLGTSVIPEHDYIWRGGFELLRDGRRCPQFLDGIQAHLSSFASHKVPEVVKKFPHKIQLEEVSRLSTWPGQFQEKEVTEDNIALYIFAKDAECYDMHYKKLVENMMKNELALKGNIDGIELFIYCSNQLPKKAHRWNKLFYLWAVFRERNVNCHESHTVQNDCGAVVTAEPSKEGLPNQLNPGVITKNEVASVDLNKDLPASCSLAESSKTVEVDVTLNTQSVSLSSIKAAVSSVKPPSSDQQYEALCHNQSAGRKSLSSQYCNLSGGHTSSTDTKPVDECFGGPQAKHSNSVKEANDDEDPAAQKAKILCPLDKSKIFPIHIDEERACGVSKALDSKLSPSLKTTPVPSALHTKETVGESGIVDIKVENVDNGRPLTDRNYIDLDPWQDELMREEACCRDIKSLGKKRCRVITSETNFEASVETITPGSQGVPWIGNTNSVPVEGKILKKMKYSNEPISSIGSLENASSNKMVGSDYSSLKLDLYENFNCDDMVLGNQGNAALFQKDVDRMKGFSITDSVMISDDDDDGQPDDGPNLELALGCNNRSEKVLPSFLQRKGENNKIGLSDLKNNAGNDLTSTSLSLSLACPYSCKERTAKSVRKSDQLRPEGKCISNSLVLFGRVIDK